MKWGSLEWHGAGLIGSLGVGATLYAYRSIVAACQQRGFAPRLMIAHADLERVLPLIVNAEREMLAGYLAGFVADFENANLEFAAISAVAPHICYPQLLERTSLPIIGLLEVTRLELERHSEFHVHWEFKNSQWTASYASRNETAVEIVVEEKAYFFLNGDENRCQGFKRVTLFGNRMSMETQLFGGLPDVEVVLPSPIEITLIHETYSAVARAGHATTAQIAALRDLAHLICSRDNVQAVVLAGTDLSVVFNDSNTDFPAVDCAKLHVQAIANRLEPQSSSEQKNALSWTDFEHLRDQI